MKSLNRFQRIRRAHRHGRTLGTVVALNVAALALLSACESRPDSDGAPAATNSASEGMAGMAGMAGMDSSGDGAVQLTAAQLREFGITFATAEVRTLNPEIRTAGTVVADESRQAVVTTRFAGFIERLHVDVTGQQVSSGQPLYEIYSPEVLAAQEELLLAARLATSSMDVPGVPRGATDLQAAAMQRLRQWDVPEAQIEEVLRSGRARRTVIAVAPASGVVVEKNIVAGQSVQPGEVLYRIADLSRVWIEAQVRESEAAFLTTGVRAEAESPALPGRQIRGQVEYVYPTVEAATQSVRARIPVSNSGGALRPGMFVTVRLDVPGRSALSVPTDAVVNTGERSLVFIDSGEGRITPREIITGAVTRDFVEVLRGLEPGQRVVTSAQFLLDAESNLAEVMRGMIGQGSTGMDAMDSSEMSDRGASMRGMSMPPARR